LMPTFLSPPTHNAVRSNRKSRTPDACIVDTLHHPDQEGRG